MPLFTKMAGRAVASLALGATLMFPLVLAANPASHVASPAPVATADATAGISPELWVVFYSRTCPECEWFRAEFVPTLDGGLDPSRIQIIDIDQIEGYQLLVEVEGILETQGDQFPVLLAADRLFHGRRRIEAAEAEIRALHSRRTPRVRTLELIERHRAMLEPLDPEPMHAAAPAESATADHAPSGELPSYRRARLLYFDSPGCHECARASRAVQHLAATAPELRIVTVDTFTTDGRLLELAITTRLNVPEADRFSAPMLVSGSEAVYGGEFTDRAMAELAARAPERPFWMDWDENREFAAARGQLQGIAQRITLPALIVGGLVDGVNPCAFAVIVFLVSYLTLNRRAGKRAALLYGLSFCAGVFACYLAIGLGFLALLEFVQDYAFVVRWLLLAMGIFCLVCAAAAALDAWRAIRRGAGAMQFGMPKSFHALSHGLIRRNLGRSVMLLAAFALGILISGIELVCTGQMYLPAIMLINRTRGGLHPFGLLLVYNLAFIAPLVLVVIVGVYGFGAQTLATWGRRHAALARALVGLVLLVMGVILLVLAAR